MLSPEEYIKRYGGIDAFLNKVTTELGLTLSSRAEPYYDTNELARQFAEDTNIHPQIAAAAFGYPYFDQFLKSNLVKSHVNMLTDENGKVMFLPVINERSRHIRDDQTISRGAAVDKENKNEQRKIALAMLPENRASLLEGKRRLVDIAHELLKDGGKAISYQEMQAKYEELYNVPLGGQELRRLFQRRQINRIFTTLMNDEFKLFICPEMPGQIFINLRAPRDVLFAKFDEYEKEQENFQNRMKENSYGNLPDRRRHGPKRPPIAINALKSILPPIQVGEDDFNEEDVFSSNINYKPFSTDKFVIVKSAETDRSKMNDNRLNLSPKADGNCANNTFNKLWDAAESHKTSRINENNEQSSSEEDVRSFRKNMHKFANSSKSQQWTRRAQNSIFTSDEDDDDDEEVKTPSLAQKEIPKKSISTLKPKVSSPVEIECIPISSAEYNSDDENKRDVRIKSRLGATNHSAFSRIDDIENSFEDENLPVNNFNLISDVIYSQSGTLSKPTSQKNREEVRKNVQYRSLIDVNGKNDGVFSPYSMMAAAESEDMPPSFCTKSQSTGVGSYGTSDRSMTVKQNDFTSAYSRAGSGLSSIMTGRSGYYPQAQISTTSFEFLKHKHANPERIKYLSFFISSVVLYRSPEVIEYQMLIEALKKLDYNYEIVLNGMSVIEFIERNCASVAILVHNDSVGHFYSAFDIRQPSSIMFER